MEVLSMLRSEVRSILQEGMSEYRALSFLAKEAILILSKNNFDLYTGYVEHNTHPHDALRSAIRYDDLKSILSDEELSGTDVAAMISNINGRIGFAYRTDKQNIHGDYGSKKDDGNIIYSEINLFYGPQFLHGLKQFNNGLVDIQRLTTILIQAYERVLVHELKHALDDYRLGEHFNKDSEFKRKYSTSAPSPPTFTDEDDTEWLEYYRQYLNLPHEVWARFAEVVHNTEFKELDHDIMFKVMPDGSPGGIYHMNDLGSAIRSLQRMRGWEYMDQRQKRRLINAMSGIWHEENEWVKENNKKVNAA